MALNDAVCWLNMEEATGATRVDISANGHSFANNGTVSQTTGLIGNAAGFPGTAGSYLSNASAFIASGAFSVSLWVNATVFPTGANFWAQGNGSTANQFLGVFTTGAGEGDRVLRFRRHRDRPRVHNNDAINGCMASYRRGV